MQRDEVDHDKREFVMIAPHSLGPHSFGVYVHFPWCVQKCAYCDFNSKVGKIPHERYLEALIRELDRKAPAFAGRTASSIYVGGGTPSLWEPSCLQRLFAALRDHVNVAPDAEITVECNPGTVDAARIAAIREAGANRLSLGVQALDDGLLDRLGRIHSAAEAWTALERVRTHFDNFSFDLIYGIPGQTLADLDAELERAMRLSPRHLSLYALTVEPGTALFSRVGSGQEPAPDEAIQAEMMTFLGTRMAELGRPRYEVSNYAMLGFESRHNLLYWVGGETLALGAGAVGLWRDRESDVPRAVRTKGHRSADRLMESALRGEDTTEDREELGPESLFVEAVMVGMRRTRGVADDEVFAASGIHLEERAGRALARCIADGSMVHEKGRWATTPKGMLMLDSVIERLVI